MKRNGIYILSILASLLIICTARIYAVNHQQWIKDYQSVEVVYNSEEDVALTDGFYFIGFSDYNGYHVKLLDAELVELDSLLKEYDYSMDSLISQGVIDDYSNFEYVCIVTMQIYNTEWVTEQSIPLYLDNFLLIGPDSYISPSVEGIHAIPGFDPELGQLTGFYLKSDRTIEIKVPYLIKTKSDGAISLNYFLNNSYRILLSTYPQETYIELSNIALRN